MITEIMFDMDGVLFDLERKVVELLKRPYEELSKNDIWSVLNQKGIFAQLPLMEGVYELLDFAFNSFEKVSILSATGHSQQHRILKEKAESININFSQYLFDSVNFVQRTSHKANYANETRLIIDDRKDQVVKPFIEAGGKAIWFKNSKQVLSDLVHYL